MYLPIKVFLEKYHGIYLIEWNMDFPDGAEKDTAYSHRQFASEGKPALLLNDRPALSANVS